MSYFVSSVVKSLLLPAVAFAGLSAVSQSAQSAPRDTISVVGSSTVYPFSTVVAERFGRATAFTAPKIESTGTGGGFKMFCQGVGADTPDITNASRRIKQSEFDDCQANGVTQIVEVLIGYDGIAIAAAKRGDAQPLSLRELFLALAKDLPGPDGKLAPNPNKTWRDVNPAMPATRIEVLGPPPTSGTRDAFVELAMAEGAKSYDQLRELNDLPADKADRIKAIASALGISSSVYDSLAQNAGKPPKGEELFKTIAYAIREDGAYVEAGENDNLIVQKLAANPDLIGIFGYSFLEENLDKVQGFAIDGVEPSFDTIADGSYAISRPLYFYIKQAHVGRIPGIHEFALEFTSSKAMGEDGYLSDKGLIPLAGDELKTVQDNVRELKPLAL